MGSWKFYASAVKGTVSLGANGFPDRFKLPGSQEWEDFAKQIPENLPPVAAAEKATAPLNNSENCSSSSCAVTVTNSNNNPPETNTCNNDTSSSANVAPKSKEAPTPVPGCSTSTAIDMDDEIEILEIPKDPPELIDLTEEDNQSKDAEEADLEVEFVSITRNVVADAEEDDIIFLGEVVRHCKKCGGKIIVITLD